MNTKYILPVLALSLFASSALVANAQTNSAVTKPIIDMSCIKRAVDSRESKLGTSFSTFSSSIGTAYSTRRASLATAYDLTDKKARREAVRKAFNTFRDSAKKARTDFRASRESAWKTFESDRKACKAQDEGTSENKSADTLSI